MTCWSCQAENDLTERQTCSRCGAPLIRSGGVHRKTVLFGTLLVLIVLQLVCVLRPFLH
jgi:uncharacterized paraquat-inducible protein A